MSGTGGPQNGLCVGLSDQREIQGRRVGCSLAALRSVFILGPRFAHFLFSFFFFYRCFLVKPSIQQLVFSFCLCSAETCDYVSWSRIKKGGTGPMRRAPSGVSGREIPGWRLRNASAPGTGGKKKRNKWQRSRCDSLLVCCLLRLCALRSRGDDWPTVRQIRT